MEVTPAAAEVAAAPAAVHEGGESSGPSAGVAAAALERTESGASERASRRSPRARLDDGASKVRTRNMFGMMMSTLKRARQEVSASEQGAAQQQKLQAVDEKLRSDRMRALEQAREQRGARLVRETEHRAALVKEQAELERDLRALNDITQQVSLSHLFVRTETEPPIYYLPKVHNDATSARLRSQQRAVLSVSVAQLDEIEGRRPLPPQPSPSGPSRATDESMADGEERRRPADGDAPAAAAPDGAVPDGAPAAADDVPATNAMDDLGDDLGDEAVVSLLD